MRATALASRLRNVATLTTSPVRLPSRFPCCARFVVPAAALRDVHASAGTGVPSPQGPGDLPDGPESAVPGIKDRGNPGGPKQQAMSNTTPGGAGSAADGAGGYAEGEEEHASADPPEQHDAEPSAHAPTGGGEPDDPHVARAPIIMAMRISPAASDSCLPPVLAHGAMQRHSQSPMSHSRMVTAHSLTPEPERVPEGMGIIGSSRGEHGPQQKLDAGGSSGVPVGEGGAAGEQQPERFHPGCDSPSFLKSDVQPMFHGEATSIKTSTSPAGYSHELDTGCLDEAAGGGPGADVRSGGSSGGSSGVGGAGQTEGPGGAGATPDMGAPHDEVDLDVLGRPSAGAAGAPATLHRGAASHDAFDIGEPLPGRAMHGGSADAGEGAASAHVRSPLRHPQPQQGGGPHHPPDTRVE